MFKRPLSNAAKKYFTSFPLERGKWRAWRLFNKPSGKEGFTEGSYRTKHGFNIYLDPKQYIDKFIYYWGEWEPDETHVVKTLLKPNDTFLDIGANIGYFSILAAQIVQSHGKVYSFEPVPATIDALQNNISLNALNNIEVFGNAAVDEERTIKIAKRGEGENSGLNSMRFQENRSDHWEVKGVRIDETIPTNTPIKLIKLDVEGAELFALKGLDKILTPDNAPMVLCEVTDSFLRELGSSAKELYQFMTDCGYNHTYNCHNKTLTAFNPADYSAFQENVLFSKAPINLS